MDCYSKGKILEFTWAKEAPVIHGRKLVTCDFKSKVMYKGMVNWLSFD